jgi:hypothetical protein
MRRVTLLSVVLLLVLLPAVVAGQSPGEDLALAPSATQERLVVFEAFTRST